MTAGHPAALGADPAFDHPAGGRTHTGESRIAGPDVVRAVALIGVVVMNYHGYLNGSEARAEPGEPFAARLFDPWEGVLATRFAATFVLVAGIGVALFSRRSLASGDRDAIRADRWRLFRRGLVLYAGGFVLNWVWPGTILFFYGAYFMVAALVLRWRSRWLVLLGVASAGAAAGLAWWRFERELAGHSTAWLAPADPDTPRELLIRTFVDYTHPLLPWLAFLLAGMVIGRALPSFDRLRWPLAAFGGAMLAGSYAVASWWDATSSRAELLTSTRPYDRGLAYTVGTLGSSIVVYCVVSWVADRWTATAPVELLRRAGQLTLSVYLAHVFVFRGVVDWWGWVGPTGLDTALVLSAVFWVLAIAVAAWWQHHLGAGPAERLYRALGG